ncbi:MAG TPA: glycosyltransferase [Nitrospirae bacterium]|nr:2-phospho-L-lactate guanylyltransferase [bacterium BMS3Abin10]GBE37954.1 2-phospho-L-lactate guanylyltransferase [bacterium BMS3Bbin08]HDH50295.1 glycosyltransferase [Nitrospirota bacterium]HDO26393.1 glycosyltransferase [Nitrospirota bacterium]HDZ84533.1 glycosyltransferase [Nitrospirota bacterium]
MKNKNALIIIAKYPELNNVMTRLAGSMPDKKRLVLYISLLESTVQRLRSIPGVDTFIAYAPQNSKEYFSKFNVKLLPLSKGDLGERMLDAMSRVLAEGYEKTALAGVDIPELTGSIILKAFELLSGNDIVYGPAGDGGYYLVGIKKPVKEIFNDIQWSTERTLEQCMDKAKQFGYSVVFTKTLSDVDTPEDLENTDLPTY